MSAGAPGCAGCGAALRRAGQTACWPKDPEHAPGRPASCPGDVHGAIAADALAVYGDVGTDARLARAAAHVEGRAYARSPDGALQPRWTRLEDTLALAREMGWRKIGIASCVGLLEETRQLVEILEVQGFEPLAVCCKVGAFDKEALGIPDAAKVRPGSFEPACHPVAQARILNALGADVNLIMGLCVGHDMLFTKHADAPTSTLVAKDRVTGHNPVAALSGGFYFRRLRTPPQK